MCAGNISKVRISVNFAVSILQQSSRASSLLVKHIKPCDRSSHAYPITVSSHGALVSEKGLPLFSVLLPIQCHSNCLKDYFLVSGISTLDCTLLNKVRKKKIPDEHQTPESLCEHANQENHFHLDKAALSTTNTMSFWGN